VKENCTNILLAHARLYIFAHVRLVSELKGHILYKLHKTLIHFKLYPQRIGDILELARYVYACPDLPSRSENGFIDDIKKMVLDFMFCYESTIGKTEEFANLMEEGGEFVGDFWRLSRQQMQT
jgi:hypothetical protein